MSSSKNTHTRQGIVLAVVTTMIWAGNFIIARSVIHKISPVSLAFYRWLFATLLLLPVSWSYVKADWALFKKHFWYFVPTALAGITLFNTLVYIAGHYTSAINLALIGTTSSPVFSVIMAAVFLKEKIQLKHYVGLLLCITGVLILIAKGSFISLLNFHFSTGDLWVLGGAFFFAVYNILVRKKPQAIHAFSFLFFIFLLGTVMLVPAFLIEQNKVAPITWDKEVIFSVLYLSLGASVICFILWNKAIRLIGAAQTALFGNLIPVFSSLAAVIILNEQFKKIHFISSIFVFLGLLIANLKWKKA